MNFFISKKELSFLKKVEFSKITMNFSKKLEFSKKKSPIFLKNVEFFLK